jgi:GntP family gluconate:H+ symporter
MGLGALVSIPALIGAYFYSNHIGKKVKSKEDIDIDAATKTYEEIVASYGKLPSGPMSLAPIVMPILLMAIGSIASMAKWTGFAFRICTFLGTPIIALAVGVLFGVFALAGANKMADFYNITNETLKVVGPILFITAAGGVLGRVISSTAIVAFITENSKTLATVGIFFPFLLSAILKTAQGSSTVALTTSSAIVYPLLGVLGLDSVVGAGLCVMAIGAGAMTVSHANDSYFWVVTNFGGMTPEQGYKTQTTATLIEGICGMVGVFILSLILI